MHRSGSTAEPDYAMALARIQHMGRDELNELLDNDSTKMEEYIKSLDQVNFQEKFLHCLTQIENGCR